MFSKIFQNGALPVAGLRRIFLISGTGEIMTGIEGSSRSKLRVQKGPGGGFLIRGQCFKGCPRSSASGNVSIC